MSTTVDTPPLQVTQHQVASRSEKYSSKRVRPKSVKWELPDRICKVCLFAIEDAPASLRLVSQDLLEAKKVKMLHASSAIDVHPGSGIALTKRAKLDMAAVLAMDAQMSWKCPMSVLHDPSWLVAAGDDSLEVQRQQHREVRTLEAFYPRASALPASPIEPPSQEAEVDNFSPIEIPIVPLEDEEGAYGGNAKSSTIESTSSSKISTSISQIDSDIDVAAAAAAAFAVLKAQEKGSLIDCDLLIKILNNPLLTDCLKNNNISIPRISDSMGSAENGRGKGLLGSLNAQGRTDSLSEGKGVLRWQQVNRLQQLLGINTGRAMHPRGTHELARGILGNGQKLHITNPIVSPLCQDTPRGLFPSLQGRSIPINGTKRQSPISHNNMSTPNLIGTNSQLLLESSFNPYLSRKLGGFPPRTPAGARQRRPCLFVNTPKGCRNGVHCNFLHDVTVVEPLPHAQCDKPSSATKEEETTKDDDQRTDV